MPSFPWVKKNMVCALKSQSKLCQKKITPLLESEPCMKGIMNLRGAIIPVFDLAQKLELKSSQSKKKIIVIEIGDKTIGFSVDEVFEVVIFEKIEQSPISDNTGIITGIARDDSSSGSGGGMVIILDPEKLI